jgi:hypothetical protein
MNFITELIKYLGSPTRGKWPILITTIVFGLILLVSYERYTATFRLGRLQKESDLLARLQETQMRSTNVLDPELIRLQAVLLANAAKTIEEKPISLEFVPSKLTFSFDSLWKFVWGGSLWLVFAIIWLPKSKTKEGKEQIKGFFVLAVVSGVIGLFVPPIWWPWFHIFIFPWLLIICFFIAIAPFAIVIANFQKARKTALANTCINNLRRIDAAKNQWKLENRMPADAIPTEENLRIYLKEHALPKCPVGGMYAINPLNHPPTCSVAGHHH